MVLEYPNHHAVYIESAPRIPPSNAVVPKDYCKEKKPSGSMLSHYPWTGLRKVQQWWYKRSSSSSSWVSVLYSVWCSRRIARYKFTLQLNIRDPELQFPSMKPRHQESTSFHEILNSRLHNLFGLSRDSEVTQREKINSQRTEIIKYLYAICWGFQMTA